MTQPTGISQSQLIVTTTLRRQMFSIFIVDINTKIHFAMQAAGEIQQRKPIQVNYSNSSIESDEISKAHKHDIRKAL